MKKFDIEPIKGVYGITVVGDGQHAGKIVLKKNHKENKGKTEKALNVFSEGAEIGILAQTIVSMMYAKKEPITPQMWELVSGGIEDYDKDAQAAMIREIEEETGITIPFERVSLLETLSPNEVTWFASVVVYQTRPKLVDELSKKVIEFSDETIHAIGFSIILLESDLQQLGIENKDYILISPNDLRTEIITMLDDETLRIATAAMLIDFVTNSTKRDISKSHQEATQQVTQFLHTELEQYEKAAAAGD
jgi:8-oxo-dGTP pyrophosphatase MutT (NUDIX family)